MSEFVEGSGQKITPAQKAAGKFVNNAAQEVFQHLRETHRAVSVMIVVICEPDPNALDAPAELFMAGHQAEGISRHTMLHEVVDALEEMIDDDHLRAEHHGAVKN